jgi:MFS family permease
MLFTLVLMILANFCYSLADKVVFDTLTSNLAMLMTGRFLVGFAAGNFAVVQAYFSYATKPSQRLAVMSWNAGTTVIGFVVGPAIAAACHVDTTIFGGRVPINSWTLPGYLSAIAAILAVIAMFFVEDVPRPSAAALARESVSAAEIAAEKKARRDGERAALLGGGAGADAATRRASSLRSASGTARVETQRRAGSVANYGAWLFGGSGYYEQSIPAHKVAGPNADGDDRAKTWAGGFSLDRSASIVAYSSMNYGNAHGGSVLASNLPIPWAAVVVCLFLNFSITLTFTSLETIGPPYTESNPGLKWQEWQTGIYFMVLGFVCIVSLVLLQFLVKLLSDRAILPLMCLMMSVGYSLNFNLHDGVYPPVWCFYLSSALTSMGYAAGTAVLLAIFSKVLEGLDQGMFMGAFSAACSTARIAGPLVSSYVLQLDPQARWVFGGVAIALLVSALVSLASFRLLKPRCEEQAEAGEEGGVVVTAAAAEGGEFDAAPVVHSPSRARIN